MAYRIECPRCAKVGLVRVEHVIKAGSATRAFYCGACEHQWSTAEQGQPSATQPPPPLPKPRTRSYGPKRHE